MTDSEFSFSELREALLESTQSFIDQYSTKFPEDGPILAFCLYFDTQCGARGMMYPLRASVEKDTSSVSDVASWYYYGDHIDDPYTPRMNDVADKHEEAYFSEDEDRDGEQFRVQFTESVRWVMGKLNFDQLPKAPDFMYFAVGMDEDYDYWDETIPKKLREKYFG